MRNRLGFVSGESPTHRLHYWEPVVDGRLLRQILDASSEDPSFGAVGDNVPVLVHSWPARLPNEVFVLLGEQPPELASGRIPIFVCPACGDLGCGAITAEVEWTAETVTWWNFGWDVSYVNEEDDDVRLPAPALVFDRGEYEAELRRFIATFDEVRNALPPRLHPSTRREVASPARRHRWWPFG